MHALPSKPPGQSCAPPRKRQLLPQSRHPLQPSRNHEETVRKNCLPEQWPSAPAAPSAGALRFVRGAVRSCAQRAQAVLQKGQMWYDGFIKRMQAHAAVCIMPPAFLHRCAFCAPAQKRACLAVPHLHAFARTRPCAPGLAPAAVCLRGEGRRQACHGPGGTEAARQVRHGAPTRRQAKEEKAVWNGQTANSGAGGQTRTTRRMCATTTKSGACPCGTTACCLKC